jgi:hypothetical protein
MVEAIFIKTNKVKYICNICSEEIEDDKVIGLKCNPDKHIFCYDCIIEWYKELKVSKKNSNMNYDIFNMCPICRDNGGLLPVYKNDKVIKGIHIPNYHLLNKNNLNNKCGMKLLTKNKYCSFIGKPEFNNLCGKHAHLFNNTDPIICGIKLLTKDGFCQLSGKSEYNNLCKVHFSKSKLII